MAFATQILAPLQHSSWLRWLGRELAPFPGRRALTLRFVVGTVAVTIISMTLQTPLTAISAFFVMFITKQNRRVTTIAGVGAAVGATIGVALSLLLYRHTFGYPELRIPVMAAALFGAVFLSRVLVPVLGQLANAICLVVVLTQGMADSASNTDELVRGLLWLWVVVVLPVAVAIIFDQIILPAQSPASAGGHSKAAGRAPNRKTGLFVADALTNPTHVRFALKVTLAAMSCYIIYSGVDWPQISTALVTCVIVAFESREATIRKAVLRLTGCAIGGLLGFLAIMYLVPHMQSITSLSLLTTAGAALAGWVAAGSKHIAYAGLQIALAFFMCIFQGFAPKTEFDPIRNRLVGIALGIVVTSIVFHYVWPEHEADTEAAL
jgi:uncharacterized membrane protein YccC